MTVLELKRKSLHEKIDKLDLQHLEMLESMIAEKEEVFQIPEHMLEGIKQGMDDIKHGRIHTMEDFEKRYEKWLKG